MLKNKYMNYCTGVRWSGTLTASVAVCVSPRNSQRPQGLGIPADAWDWGVRARPAPPHTGQGGAPQGHVTRMGLEWTWPSRHPFPRMRVPFLIDLACVGQMSSLNQSLWLGQVPLQEKREGSTPQGTGTEEGWSPKRCGPGDQSTGQTADALSKEARVSLFNLHFLHRRLHRGKN